MEISAYIIATLIAWLSLGWCVHNRLSGLLRASGLVLMAVLTVSVHWHLWDSPAWTRTIIAIPMFLFLGKTWKLAARATSPTVALSSISDFTVWAVAIPEGHWVIDSDARSKERARSRTRILRSLLKGTALVSLLYLNQTADLTVLPGLLSTWMCFTLYLTFSGLWDMVAGTAGLVGISIGPMFNAPPIARNPRDFWGRRWNLWFTSTAHQLIFLPLGGRERPALAVSAVFVFSALLHEAIIALGLKAFDGRMIVFFIMHGIAAGLFTLFSRRWPKPWPRPVAVAAHFVWMVASASWFMGPMDDCISMSQWTLESAATFLFNVP